MLFLSGHGDPARSQIAYGILIDVFRSFLDHASDSEQGEFREAVTNLAPFLASSLFPELDVHSQPGAGVDPDLRQAVFVARVSALLFQLSRRHPVGVCLEDLQFADSASLKVLGSLATRNADEALLIVATCHNPEITSDAAGSQKSLGELRDQPHCVEIELDRLSEGETRAMVYSCFEGSGFRNEVMSLLMATSAGLPLHIIQYLGWLLEDGVIFERRGLWMDRSILASETPPTFDVAMRARVATLSEADQEVLRYAAVMGEEIECELLGESVGHTPAQVRSALGRIARRTQLVDCEDGVYRFCHSLLWRSVYSDLPQEQRRDTHLRVATCLERHDSPDVHLLAHHFYQAGAIERGVPYLLELANGARDAFAYWEARQSLSRALEGLHPVDDRSRRFEALLALADASASLGDLDHCLELCQEVLNAAGDTERAVLGEARLQLGSVYSRTGRWAEAEAFLQESRRLFAQIGDDRSCATVDMRLGNIAFERSQLDDALAHYSRARQVAIECECPSLLGSIAGNLGVIATVRGDYDAADRHYGEALAAYGRAQHQFGLSQTYLNQGMAHADRDRWHEALGSYSQAEQLARDMGTIDMIANVLVNRSVAQIATGDFDGAEASCNGASLYYGQLRDGLGLAECGKAAGMLSRSREQYAAADEQLRDARESFRGLDNQLGVAECDLELAVVLRHLGDLCECRACLREASELFDQLGAEDGSRKAAALRQELN